MPAIAPLPSFEFTTNVVGQVIAHEAIDVVVPDMIAIQKREDFRERQMPSVFRQGRAHSVKNGSHDALQSGHTNKFLRALLALHDLGERIDLHGQPRAIGVVALLQRHVGEIR